MTTSENMYGKPVFCDINKILDAAEEFINGDDCQKAMMLLDNLPSYYQDNYPARAYEIKKTFYQKLWTMEDYLKDSWESEWSEEAAIKHYHEVFNWRKEYVKDLVKAHTDSGSPIHIVELGASNHWLPIGMDKVDGLKFTYESIGPNIMATKLAKERLPYWKESPDYPHIFVCMEVIEHCLNPTDIFHYYCKIKRECEYIVMSTPRYIVGGGQADWRSRKELAHVRTWGMHEFKRWAETTFPMHNFYTHDLAHLMIRGFMKKLEKMQSTVQTVNEVQA